MLDSTTSIPPSHSWHRDQDRDRCGYDHPTTIITATFDSQEVEPRAFAPVLSTAVASDKAAAAVATNDLSASAVATTAVATATHAVSSAAATSIATAATATAVEATAAVATAAVAAAAVATTAVATAGVATTAIVVTSSAAIATPPRDHVAQCTSPLLHLGCHADRVPAPHAASRRVHHPPCGAFEESSVRRG